MLDNSSYEDIKVLFTKVLAPALGVLTSEFLALGPLSAILESRKSSSIGALNPIVFPLLLGNSIGWVIYSAAVGNPYVFCGNVGGVMLSFFYVLSVYSLTNSNFEKLQLEVMSIFLMGMWCCVGFAVAMLEDKNLGVNIIGVLANIVVFLLFASPLATFSVVISTKDSSSINRPFAFCQVLNCALWTAYGFSVEDPYVYLPNVVGLVLGLMQLALIILYPSGHGTPPYSETFIAEHEEH